MAPYLHKNSVNKMAHLTNFLSESTFDSDDDSEDIGNLKVNKENCNQMNDIRRFEPTQSFESNRNCVVAVNAWKRWVESYNPKICESAKPKMDILKMPSHTFNSYLSEFALNVRKKNGKRYTPDQTYYFCLGLQYHMFANGFVDNIFFDPAYKQFTDTLNYLAKNFVPSYRDQTFILTSVLEEYLWECKQLGLHSPQVLLNTLMYYYTRDFKLTTLQDHLELSFERVLKRRKLSRRYGKYQIVRYYTSEASRLRKNSDTFIYEQIENKENPYKCPVKLYEFYLSKCPAVAKTRKFFYLKPRRLCVYDSPLWYTNSTLPLETMEKMLNRALMVNQFNTAQCE